MQATTKRITRVLLIDDDPEELMILESAIYQVNPAIEVAQLKDSSKKLSDCGIEDYDIIFLDVNMPLLDGFEWLSRLRNSGNAMPVIMYSTTMHQGRINKAYECGAHLFFPKPDTFHALIRSLSCIFQFDWMRPEEVKERFLHNGNYLPFTMDVPHRA